ncbi:HNH endonuclease [Vibrio phage F99]
MRIVSIRSRPKPVYGVGWNDSDYRTQIRGQPRCPYYVKWSGMLQRCYSIKWQENNPTYKGCLVCEDWLYFSNFRNWMENQNWKDCELDKDILGDGKLYSPTTCAFIPRQVNKFILGVDNVRGELPIGVIARGSKYRASCQNPFNKKQERLGTFCMIEEAALAWRTKKLEHLETLKNMYNLTSEVFEGLKEVIYNRK